VKWFKLESDFTDHPKVLAVGMAAAWVQLRAMCHASHYNTKGIIGRNALRALGGTPAIIKKLVDIGLLDEHPQGFYIHNWRERQDQKTDEEVEQLSKLRSDAGKKGARAKQLARQLADDLEANGQQRSSNASAELELEEGSPPIPTAPSGAVGISGSPAAEAQKGNELWDAFVEVCGEALTASERSGRGKAVKEVREAGGRPEQLRPAAAEFRRIFPQLTMTDLAIARHWGKLVGKPRAEFRCPICGVVEKTQRKLNYHVEVIHA